MQLFFLQQQPATTAGSHAQTIQLGKNNFGLVKSGKDLAEENYICISYAWGKGKVAHPLEPQRLISDKTLPVLSTAMEAYKNLLSKGAVENADNFWIDALCIPTEESESRMHNIRIGEIYSKALAVIIVLSKEMAGVFNKIRNNEKLQENDLRILDTDNWVSRYWTYQEIVNSGKLAFTCIDNIAAPILGEDFLYAISSAMHELINNDEHGNLEATEKLPNLYCLEAVMVDWKIGNHGERSVYQIMTSMEYRISDLTQSKILAMLGCITNQPAESWSTELSDEELFFETCKRKGDYSYIFNTSTNRLKGNHKWQPLNFDFEPTFSWLFSWGKGQQGVLTDNYLELKNVNSYSLGNISHQTTTFLENIMLRDTKNKSFTLLQVIENWLVRLKFKGMLTPIELNEGFYFHQSEVDTTGDLLVIVATGVRWTFGAPAILVAKSGNSEVYDFIGAGVFFGKVQESTLAVKIN